LGKMGQEKLREREERGGSLAEKMGGEMAPQLKLKGGGGMHKVAEGKKGYSSTTQGENHDNAKFVKRDGGGTKKILDLRLSQLKGPVIS